MRILFVLLALIGMSAHALTDSEVRSSFTTVLEPFYGLGAEVNFQGKKNVHLVGRYFKHSSPSLGTIVVANGFGETIHKYVEVAYDLYQAGYSVFLYDHRGQGESQHLLADPQRGYIDNFEYMIADLKKFFETVVKAKAPGPYFLLGHSMGGMVGARYIEEHPDDFVAATLSSPMLGIDFGWLGVDRAKWILDAAEFFGYDDFYVSGPTNPLTVTFAKQTVTHDEIRYNVLNQGIRSLDPQQMIFGATARWVDQSIHAGLNGVADASRAHIPILMFQAGNDTVVAPEPERDYCGRAPNCHLTVFANAHHEILMETDDIREDAIDQILKHFGSYTHSTVNENQILF